MSIDIEPFHVERTGMHRTVDQTIKILGNPCLIDKWQRNVDGPCLRYSHCEAMLMPTTTFHFHGDSSQAQGCEIGIEVTGPHRQVARFDRIVEGESLLPWHLNHPAGRAYSPRTDGVISTVRNKTVEVLNVISDGVGTRRPNR